MRKSISRLATILLFAFVAICCAQSGSTGSAASGSPAQGETDLIGQSAPAFKLPAHSGGDISLDQYLGKQAVVLAFYPKDFTSG